jgi:hypothetical protein
MLAVRCPMNSYRAISLGLANFFVIFEAPEVNFTCQVSKTTNKCNLRERANLYSVSIPFAKFKKGIAIFVIQCSYCWLSSRDDNKSLSILYPYDIMNHTIKDWNKYS